MDNDELLNIDNNEWNIRDGLLLEYRGKSKDIVIPEGVEKIGVLALRGLMLKSVVFPDSLKIIDDEALKFNQLTEIVLPPNLVSIGKEAFCLNNLKRVSIPSSVQKIDIEAFIGNEIAEMTISDKTITSICVRNPKFFKQLEASMTLTVDFCTDPIMNTLYLLKGFPGKIVLYEEQVPVYLRPKIENEILPKKNISYIERKPSITIASPNVVKYHLDEKPDRDTFEVIDGVLVKYHNVSGNTDVEIPHGVKEIAPSVFRDMLLTSVKIPDTVEKIGACAFYQCLLKRVTLPKNLKYIGDYAFFDNCLTTLEIPEGIEHLGANFHAKNPIQTLVVPSLKNMDKFGHSIVNKISELVVDNSNGEAFETIRKFKGYIIPSKIIVVGGSPLTKKEKRQIGEMFDIWFIHYSHVEWNKPQETLEKENITPVEKADGLNIKDPEVQKIIDGIQNTLKDTTPEFARNIEEEINTYLKEYDEEIARLERDINNIDSVAEPSPLELTPKLPISIKANLLIKLESLLTKIKRDVPKSAFESDLDEYEEILRGKRVPVGADALKSKVEVIAVTANKFAMESLRSELRRLIEATRREVASLNYNVTDCTLVLEDPLEVIKTNFSQKLEELEKKATHYFEFYTMLDGRGDSSIAKDIAATKKIIASLDDASKVKYGTMFDTLLNKFRVIGVNMDKNTFEENFRREFHKLLEGLSKIVPLIEKRKNLLNSINRSLKTVKDGLPFSREPDAIESIIEDIYTMLENPAFTEEKRKGEKEKIKNLLIKKNAELLSARKPNVPEDKSKDYPYYIDNYFSILREDTLLEIEILRSLSSIKLEVEFDLMKLTELKDYKLE